MRKLSQHPRNLRTIPSVGKVLQAVNDSPLPRTHVVEVIREELRMLRRAEHVPELESIYQAIRGKLAAVEMSRIQTVLNGTGVLANTNLGRSPLATPVLAALRESAAAFNNLEYNLSTGKRGSRGQYLETGLAHLCGAESATVVNNCAAALVLILRHFTAGDKKEVVISRGELIQIGGGFRIPDILASSGAVLREVGTTNKTTVADYSQAIGKNSALILRVHRSNFFMGGFVESAETQEIGALARRKRLPFVEDLGSGSIVPVERIAPVAHEPTPAEIMKRGADLVCFSGDKLFGGPQAGIIAGRTRHISALKREPFFRAMRCDKLILTCLQATTDLYLRQDIPNQIPLFRMLRMSTRSLHRRALKILQALSGEPARIQIGHM